MESYVRIGGRGFEKSYVHLYGGRGVKSCQNHANVIIDWLLIFSQNSKFGTTENTDTQFPSLSELVMRMIPEYTCNMTHFFVYVYVGFYRKILLLQPQKTIEL